MAGSLSQTALEQGVGAVERWLLCTKAGFLCSCTSIISWPLCSLLCSRYWCAAAVGNQKHESEVVPNVNWDLFLKYLSLLCCFCAPLPIFYVIINLPGKAKIYTPNTAPWDLCGASHLYFVVICVLRSQTCVWLVQCQSSFVLYFTNEYLIALSVRVPRGIFALVCPCCALISACRFLFTPVQAFFRSCKGTVILKSCFPGVDPPLGIKCLG